MKSKHHGDKNETLLERLVIVKLELSALHKFLSDPEKQNDVLLSIY
jgi:hypothetical protein